MSFEQRAPCLPTCPPSATLALYNVKARAGGEACVCIFPKGNGAMGQPDSLALGKSLRLASRAQTCDFPLTA